MHSLAIRCSDLHDPERKKFFDSNRLCPPTFLLPTRQRRRLHHKITSYEIPVIEVDGEMGDIIRISVRINSTGKALTSQERRHASYYNSPFLKEASRLARRFETYFLDNNILSPRQPYTWRNLLPDKNQANTTLNLQAGLSFPFLPRPSY